jgi:hypothetical protein
MKRNEAKSSDTPRCDATVACVCGSWQRGVLSATQPLDYTCMSLVEIRGQPASHLHAMIIIFCKVSSVCVADAPECTPITMAQLVSTTLLYCTVQCVTWLQPPSERKIPTSSLPAASRSAFAPLLLEPLLVLRDAFRRAEYLLALAAAAWPGRWARRLFFPLLLHCQHCIVVLQLFACPRLRQMMRSHL